MGKRERERESIINCNNDLTLQINSPKKKSRMNVLDVVAIFFVLLLHTHTHTRN